MVRGHSKKTRLMFYKLVMAVCIPKNWLLMCSFIVDKSAFFFNEALQMKRTKSRIVVHGQGILIETDC